MQSFGFIKLKNSQPFFSSGCLFSAPTGRYVFWAPVMGSEALGKNMAFTSSDLERFPPDFDQHIWWVPKMVGFSNNQWGFPTKKIKTWGVSWGVPACEEMF